MFPVSRLYDWHNLSVKLCILEHDTHVYVDRCVSNNIQIVANDSFWGHKPLGSTGNLIFLNIELYLPECRVCSDGNRWHWDHDNNNSWFTLYTDARFERASCWSANRFDNVI